MEADFHKKVAEALAGCTVDKLTLCRGGRNSRVYKVACGAEIFALKSYPAQAADPRDRFGTEIRALKFYEVSCNPYTPRLLATDVPRRVALLEWIDGTQVDFPAPDDLVQAVDFVSRAHVAEAIGGHIFGAAAEPCLCGADLDGHLSARLEKLVAIADREPTLRDFLLHDLNPALVRAQNFAQRTTFATPLSRDKQSLIPADFGFHNALKMIGGRMRFIDFEYFGWDDPVRLTADFLFHPSVALSEENSNHFRQGMIDIFQIDEEFEQRLLYLSPLYGIRWALILLNEFLPDRWQARLFAGETASWEQVKAIQLEKSRIALSKAIACLPAFP